MNLPNALGFFVLGLAMIVLPDLAPALVPANPAFGDEALLWMEFMGGVIFLIGSGCTAKCLAAALPKAAPEAKVPAAAPAGARSSSSSRSTIAADGERAAA